MTAPCGVLAVLARLSHQAEGNLVTKHHIPTVNLIMRHTDPEYPMKCLPTVFVLSVFSALARPVTQTRMSRFVTIRHGLREAA